METVFTYISTHMDSPASIASAKKKAYNAWTLKMINEQHCTVSIKTIMKKLHVSRSWIEMRICPRVEYVKITPQRLKELNMDDHSPLLFNSVELRQFLQDAAEFTRQTIVIDLMEKLSTSEISMLQTDPVIHRWDANISHGFGKRSNRLLNNISADYENVNEMKRSLYPAVSVPSFDFWARNLIFSSDYANRETAYRDVFRKGMIKIVFFGKTFFVEAEDTSKYTYPMTIAYTETKPET